MQKQGRDPGDIGHWVVSPPQVLVKSMMQTKEEFDNLYKFVIDNLQCYGALAGVTIFHPWRQGSDDQWHLSPHFHSLLYGRIDTDRFRKDNPGWVIKKVVITGDSTLPWTDENGILTVNILDFLLDRDSLDL